MIDQLIQNISDSEINSFFRRNISAYRIEKDELDYIIPDNGFEQFSELNKLGEWSYDNSDELLLFSCKYDGELTARSSKKKQYELAKKALKEDFKDGAIFIFYDQQGNFRFSFIRRNYDDESAKFTPFKRYTYFVNPEKQNKTFKRRIEACNFQSLDEIQNAFSVEPLSKQFYKDLSHWYFASLKEVKFPNDRDENEYSLHAIAMIRLITRIMFVWFMKQKELVPNELFDKEKLDDILNYSDSNGSTYYKAILQNLFFATLNTPRAKGRKFVNRQYGVQNFFRYNRFLNDPDRFLELMDTIPFLNGGLFENLDIVKPEEEIEIRIDCFTDAKKNESKLRVPDYLFFGTRNVDISEYFEAGNYGNVKITGLIDILNQYDFTIDENTPFDQEVALDPELLGMVFENLLASYNPETQSTARKESGSFYTPRPIVDYMVEESLVHFISNDTSLDKEQLRQVFSSTDDQPFEQEAEQSLIINSISNLKIIDPACGSGAFPMGALQKMVHALAKLDPGNTLWRKSQKERLMQETFEAFQTTDLENLKKEVDAIFDNQLNDPDYARKLYLIENCLYGVDIQPIAMQISKLRFFISLLVEQNIDREDDNFGIIALPNLETKFVAANTLVKPEKNEINLFTSQKILDLQEELRQIRHKYFTARTSKTKSKHRNRDKEIRTEMAQLLEHDAGWSHLGAEALAQWDPFNPNSKSKWFDCEWMFGIKHFDIVIGNPPYIQLQKALPGHDRMKYADVYKDFQYQTFERTGDIYALFYEKGMDILHSKGLLCYITSNKWMRAKYGKSLRKYFSEKKPLQLIDLGPGVFDAATVDVNILLIQNKTVIEHNLLSFILTNKEKIYSLRFDDFTTMKSLTHENWIILNNKELSVKSKILKNGKALREWGVNIYRGVTTGYNKAFIIPQSKRDELISSHKELNQYIKPVLRGKDIQRYQANWENLFLLFLPWHFPLHEDDTISGASIQAENSLKATFPHLYNYLLENEKGLRKRNKEETGIRYEWYALQRCAATYYDEFFKEKIVWKRIGSIIRFAYSINQDFTLDSTVILTGNSIKFLLCLLNSKLIIRELLINSPKTGTGDVIISVQALEPLLVADPVDSVKKKFEDIVDVILEKKEQDQDTSKEELQIDLMVYKLYELDYDEVLIVDPETPISRGEYESFKLSEHDL